MDTVETVEVGDRVTHLRPDMDVEADVRRAIADLDTLGPAQGGVTVSVSAGQLTLSGHVLSEIIAYGVEQVARSIPGVVEVDNQIVDDGSLMRRVAVALATDPRTRMIPPGYEVVSGLGHVVVVGWFEAEAVRAAVIDVCSAVPGARSARVKALS